MPSALTLHNPLFNIANTHQTDGCAYPWEVAGFDKDAVKANSTGGFFDFSWTSVIAIEGPDTKDFLQRMSTLDFRKLQPPSAKYGGFLTGRGTVVALGTFTVDEDGYRFWAGFPVSAGPTHIEKFHFAEKFSVRDESEKWALFLVTLGNHEAMAELKAAALGIQETGQFRGSWFSQDVRGWWDGTNRKRIWIALDRARAPKLLSDLSACGFPLLGNHLYKYFKIREGVPTPGDEITEKEILLEGNLVWAADRDKGCYPGQEVIERIFTYGSVNKQLFTVRMTGDSLEEQVSLPLALEAGGENAGSLRSLCRDPFSKNEYLGLAYILKPYWTTSQVLSTSVGNVVRDA